MSDDPSGRIIFSHFFHFLTSLSRLHSMFCSLLRKNSRRTKKKRKSTKLARQWGPCPLTTDHSPPHLKETNKQQTNTFHADKGENDQYHTRKKNPMSECTKVSFCWWCGARTFFSHRPFSWTPLQDCVPEITLCFFFGRAFVSFTDAFIVSHVQLVSRVMLGTVFAVAQTKQLNDRLVPTKTLTMANPTPKDTVKKVK